jgi:hypothetical protein
MDGKGFFAAHLNILDNIAASLLSARKQQKLFQLQFWTTYRAGGIIQTVLPRDSAQNLFENEPKSFMCCITEMLGLFMKSSRTLIFNNLFIIE